MPTAEIAYEKVVRDEPSDDAILFKIEGWNYWIPRSLVEEIDEESKIVVIPEWFAVKEELV